MEDRAVAQRCLKMGMLELSPQVLPKQTTKKLLQLPPPKGSETASLRFACRLLTHASKDSEIPEDWEQWLRQEMLKTREPDSRLQTAFCDCLTLRLPKAEQILVLTYRRGKISMADFARAVRRLQLNGPLVQGALLEYVKHAKARVASNGRRERHDVASVAFYDVAEDKEAALKELQEHVFLPASWTVPNLGPVDPEHPFVRNAAERLIQSSKPEHNVLALRYFAQNPPVKNPPKEALGQILEEALATSSHEFANSRACLAAAVLYRTVGDKSAIQRVLSRVDQREKELESFNRDRIRELLLDSGAAKDFAAWITSRLDQTHPNANREDYYTARLWIELAVASENQALLGAVQAFTTCDDCVLRRIANDVLEERSETE